MCSRNWTWLAGPQLSNLFHACSIVRKDGRTLYVLLLFLIFELRQYFFSPRVRVYSKNLMTVVVILTVWRGIRDRMSLPPVIDFADDPAAVYSSTPLFRALYRDSEPTPRYVACRNTLMNSPTRRRILSRVIR